MIKELFRDPAAGNSMLAFLIVINIIWRYNLEAATIDWLIYISPLITICLVIYFFFSVLQLANNPILFGPYWKKK